MYIRQNCTEEFLGDLRGVSQPTVSRILADLVPAVRSVLAEFVPDPKEVIRLVKGKVCPVDGTITPCWSYAEHRELWSRKHGTTGFCVQLISLLDGTPVWISEPLPGSTHDKNAFDNTATTKIVNKAKAGIGDKGYQGAALFTPTKKPQWRKLNKGEKNANAAPSALRAPVERVVSTSRTGEYSTPTTAVHTPPIAKSSMLHAHYSSSRSMGVLNNALSLATFA